MINGSTTSNTTTLNKLRNILNEYRGRSLDESLTKRIEDVCLDLEADSTQKDTEITKKLEDTELPKVPNGFKERRELERRNQDKIIDGIGVGLCMLDKELKITWANQTLCD